ncbi:hypothetical protein M5E87_21710 [Flavonifractor plautii]|nr:hypothetical protein M5E87_21710 [Flavonifractor plautii]
MTYTIRPAGPEDAAEITALRRMPGVFEQAASLPSDRPRRMEELLRQPGQGKHVLLAVSPDHTVLGLVMLTVESNPRRRHAAWASWCAPTARDRASAPPCWRRSWIWRTIG